MVRLELDTALSIHALGSSIDEIPFHCSRVIIHGGFRFSLPIKQQRMAVMVMKLYVTSRGTSRKSWKSDMHWFNTADESAYEDFLRALAKGGFDQVLQERVEAMC